MAPVEGAAFAIATPRRQPDIRLFSSGEQVQVDVCGAASVGDAKVLVAKVLDLTPERLRLVNLIGLEICDTLAPTSLFNGCVSVHVLPCQKEPDLQASLLKATDAQTFSGLEARETLRLRDLKALPERFGDLRRLRELYFVSGNQLTALPRTIGRLRMLQTLHLEGNLLERLPATFCDLRSLRTLYLTSNRLTSLPESFGQLSSLQTLQLSQNRLEALPESFGNLQGLQSLYLHDNLLCRLPASFGGRASLQVLYLRDNRLTELPQSAGQLKALRLLYLRGNPLSEVPAAVESLPALRNLEVDPCVGLHAGVRAVHRFATELLASITLGTACKTQRGLCRPPSDCAPVASVPRATAYVASKSTATDTAGC
mmetsp:Transcript_94222/g.270162  ORF Transcript_94222/g.270162 Transcript_94222/m.270162 type:complete len:370 (+) Transcript_94222:98-1207(+)